MSETEASSASIPDGVTAGQLLRHARESAGLHIATLAVSLKVPVRKLEALEEDRYDQLSDAVFVRALASSVCRTLKVDPQPVLERLPHGEKPRLVQASDGINEPFRAPGDGPAQAWGDQLSRPVVLAVVVLLVGALVILLLPTVRHEAQTASSTPAPARTASMPAVSASDAAMPAEATASAASLAAASAASPASAGEPSVAVASSAAAPAFAAPASAPMASASTPLRAASAAVAAASAPASAAVAAASAASAPAANGIIVFRARAPSWISVTDSRGNSVLRKLMEAGETAGATGTLPLAVTVGSAPSTDVLVRGKPFDLTPVTRDNVARFEVN